MSLLVGFLFVKLSLFIGVLFVKLSLYSSRNARKQRDCGDSYKDILYEYILMNRKILMFRGSLLGGRSHAMRCEKCPCGSERKRTKNPWRGLGLNNAFSACKDFLLLVNSWGKQVVFLCVQMPIASCTFVHTKTWCRKMRHHARPLLAIPGRNSRK